MEEHTRLLLLIGSLQHILAFITMQWPFILQAYHIIRMRLGEKTASLYEITLVPVLLRTVEPRIIYRGYSGILQLQKMYPRWAIQK